MIRPNAMYVLTMVDTFFGLPLGIMGVVYGDEVPKILDGIVIGGEDDWVPCRNDCCSSKAGAGEFEGVLFKLVPANRFDGVREKVMEQKAYIASLRAEASQVTEAFTPIPEETN